MLTLPSLKLVTKSRVPVDDTGGDGQAVGPSGTRPGKTPARLEERGLHTVPFVLEINDWLTPIFRSIRQTLRQAMFGNSSVTCSECPRPPRTLDAEHSPNPSCEPGWAGRNKATLEGIAASRSHIKVGLKQNGFSTRAEPTARFPPGMFSAWKMRR